MSNKTYKYHYFYKITNNINNHFYYGVHNTNNLEDGYMGSGTKLHYAYKKYGIENFTKEILKYFLTSKEAFEYESEIVTEELVHDVNCYNIATGGKYSYEGTKNTVSVKDKNGNYFRCADNDPKYLNGEYFPVTTNKCLMQDINGNRFFVDTDDKRIKSGELFSIYKNKRLCSDKNNKKYWVDKNDERIKSGELKPVFKSKHVFTDEHKLHIRESLKNIERKSRWVCNENECIRIYEKDLQIYLDNGYKIGKTYKEKEIKNIKIHEAHKKLQYQKGEKNSQYNTCWIYNDKENKKIKKEDLEYYLSIGWLKGRKFK